MTLAFFFFFNLPPSNYACPRIVYWISDGHSPFLLKNKIFLKIQLFIHVYSVGVELDVVWTVRSFTRFFLQQLWRDVVQMLRNDPALFDTWATVCPNDEMIFKTPFAAKIICGVRRNRQQYVTLSGRIFVCCVIGWPSNKPTRNFLKWLDDILWRLEQTRRSVVVTVSLKKNLFLFFSSQQGFAPFVGVRVTTSSTAAALQTLPFTFFREFFLFL